MLEQVIMLLTYTPEVPGSNLERKNFFPASKISDGLIYLGI
jgi:hypothetical protein